MCWLLFRWLEAFSAIAIAVTVHHRDTKLQETDVRLSFHRQSDDVDDCELLIEPINKLIRFEKSISVNDRHFRGEEIEEEVLYSCSIS